MMNVVGSFNHVFVCDLGATHCRLAIVDKMFNIVHQKVIPTSSIEDFSAVINDYLEEVAHKDMRVDLGVIGAAGLVEEGKVTLTQAALSFSEQELLDTTALTSVYIRNDAQLAGYAIGSYDLASGMYLLVTIGTGLGVTPVYIGDRTVAFASEGGHTRVPSCDAVFKEMDEELPEGVRWNDVLSGKGFERIHSFFTGSHVDADHIDDEQTLTFFSEQIQGFLRDMALTLLPKKIFLAGGLVHHRADVFSAKIKPVEDERLSSAVPVEIINDDALGLKGGAFFVRRLLEE